MWWVSHKETQNDGLYGQTTQLSAVYNKNTFHKTYEKSYIKQKEKANECGCLMKGRLNCVARRKRREDNGDILLS